MAIHPVPVCFAQKHCGNGDLCSATQSDFAGSQHGLCLSNEEVKWLEWNEVKATIRTSDLVDRLKENSPALQCGLCLRTQLPGSILVLCEHSVSLVQLC